MAQHRKKLARINGTRQRFTGTFERFGTKNGYKGPEPTVLLTQVRDGSTGKIVTDHLWFNLTKRFAALDLQKGDKVAFDARVTEYEKGYKGWNWERQLEAPISIDYKLSFPTKVELISRCEHQDPTPEPTPEKA